ncbi:MAG: TadE/TadG family type IV pilus assembly protein [Terriglobales bacterium]
MDEVDQMEQTAMRQKKAGDRLPGQAARQPKTAESGQTLLEFAFMLPFMMLLLLGVAEIGRAAFITIAVSNAATAGAEYGSQNGTTASDFPGMQNAALCDANGHISLSACKTTGILTSGNITPTSGCACDTGSGTSCNQTFLACTSSAITGCSGQIVECVQVTTHADFSPLFHYPGLPTTYQANGKAVQRVRQ